MQIKLRPYQEECLKAIKGRFVQGISRQLVHLPTGAGKTVVFASLIKEMERKTLVLAHTCELLEQAKDKIKMISHYADVGIVNSEQKEFDRNIVVSSIQSAQRPDNLAELKKQGFSLCIYDEAHRAAADNSRKVIAELDFLKSSKNLLVGFSATPFRADSKGLGEVFDDVPFSMTIKDLIDLGFLCRPKGAKIRTDLDLSTVKTEEGDFVTTSLSSVMNTSEMNNLVVDAYAESAPDRKAVCFAVNVAHAKNLADAFKSRGIASESIYGGMPSSERTALLKRFQSGEISVLTNCQVLTEGWDCPEVDCVLVARPTQSKGLYQQMCGRGLRLYPNKKDCLILDFGSATHSLCGMASLLEDDEETEERKTSKNVVSGFIKNLPANLNKKLKAAITQFDPIGDLFTWTREGPSYSLKGYGDCVLKVIQAPNDRFDVVLFKGADPQVITKDISFEYAFASAEDFARSNRSLFTVSDLEADWRKLPISDKQKSFFRSHGYRAGIEDLSRGQASLIIGSGLLGKSRLKPSRRLS